MYDRAEEFPIPDEVDDRLRDILEPLFAIAVVADAEKETGLDADGMVKAARALSCIRIEDDTDVASLVAALTALRDTCEQRENRGIVISAGNALSLFQRTDAWGGWTRRRRRAACFVVLGFARLPHRRERFGDRDRPAKETARSYEIRLDTVQDRFPGTLMRWNRHRRHTQTGARTSPILTRPSRRSETANEIVRNPLGEKGCDARDCVEYRDVQKKRPPIGL